MLFGFISLRHALAFVERVARELDKLAERALVSASRKRAEAEALLAEADAHTGDFQQATRIAGALKAMTQSASGAAA